MKTAPADIKYYHPKTQFRKFEINSFSLQTIKSEQSINKKQIDKGSCFLQKFKLNKCITHPSVSKPQEKIPIRHRSLNDLENLRNIKFISRCNFENLKRGKKKKNSIKRALRKITNLLEYITSYDYKNKPVFLFKLIFVEILLPNSLALLCLTLFFYLNENEYSESCTIKNAFQVIYISFISTLGIYYFFLFGYYLFEPLVFNQVPKNKKLYKRIILIFVFLTTFLLKMIKVKGFYLIKENDLDLHIINMGIGLAYVRFLIYKFNIGLYQLKSLFIVFFSLFFIITLNYYVIKNYVYVSIYGEILHLEYGKYIFQIILLIYLKIYGEIIFNLTVKFYKLIKKLKKNQKDVFNGILLFLKYYISDAICSCIVFPIVSHDDIYDLWFGICNFSLQLMNLYSTKDQITSHFNKFWAFILSKKIKKKPFTTIHKRCKSIISGSTNDMIIIVLARIIMMSYFRQFIFPNNVSIDTTLVMDCRFIINPKIIFYIENKIILVLIAAMNLIYSFSLIHDKKHKNLEWEFIWKIESYNFLGKFCYLLVLHLVNDFHLQFYFNLYWLGAIEKIKRGE